jgi:glycerate kinase
LRVLIAPDKFKNSLTSFEACAAIEDGIREAFPETECIQFPLADGGDGTSDILTHHTKGHKISLQVHDPLFRVIDTTYGISRDGRLAFIDMANASGLRLLGQEERNVMQTTTLGTGEVICDAINRGVREIILGIGGSATNDGGIGTACALGFEFLDEKGIPVKSTGEELIRIRRIKTSNVHPLLRHIKFTAICDVDNPLTGLQGAAHVYAPQKGASPAQVEQLDQGLKNFAYIVRQQLTTDIEWMPGAGAGGGLGGGAIAFFNTSLRRGVDVVFELTDFEKEVKKADLIIAGEGKMDTQTLYGKLIIGIAQLARKHGKKVIGLTGKNELDPIQLKEIGIDQVVALTTYVSEQESMTNASQVLKNICSRQFSSWIG